MPQTIIKAMSPSPEQEDEGQIPSSPPTMPLEDTMDHPNLTAVSGDAPELAKASSEYEVRYNPSQYQAPWAATELFETTATPMTEDTKEAQEEHDTPLLPLLNDQTNQSTPRNTGAFILLWIVAIVLAPLAVAMVYAAYCIFLEFSLERWVAVMPVVPFFSKGVKEISEAAVEELVSEVSEGHAEL